MYGNKSDNETSRDNEIYWLKNSTDLSNRSCKAQLSLTIDYLTRALESKLQVDVAILDFEKAFD